MKVSVPTSYSRPESAPNKASEVRDEEPRELLSSPEPQPESEQSLPLVPAQWWQAFLYGSADALLSEQDATRAVGLVANRLGKETAELSTSIRAGELRKMIYTKFGADLALHIMHELWRQASTNGESPSVPSVSETPENVIKFFEPEDAVPPWWWESNEDRSERESLTDLGGWAGG